MRLHILCANRLYWGKTNERRGASMQVVVVKSPKLLRGLLCRLFGIKKSPKENL